MRNKLIIIISSFIVLSVAFIIIVNIVSRRVITENSSYYQSKNHQEDSFDITESPNYYENLPKAEIEYIDIQYGEEYTRNGELNKFTAYDKDGSSAYGFLKATTDNCIDYLLQKYDAEYEIIFEEVKDTSAQYVIKIQDELWLIAEAVDGYSMMWPYNYTEEEVQQSIEETGYIPEL